MCLVILQVITIIAHYIFLLKPVGAISLKQFLSAIYTPFFPVLTAGTIVFIVMFILESEGPLSLIIGGLSMLLLCVVFSYKRNNGVVRWLLNEK